MERDIQRVIGSSSILAATLDQTSRLAAINRPILIMGERGSGKELIAERLHFLSERWEQPFITLNCAAINDELMESELFGHEPGAFTGATRIHHGRFERADGGTLFLDELGTMSAKLQEKLLRLIEYGEFERLGSQKTLRVDVRIIAATNANLRDMAAHGEFRDDLLDRLAFDVIHVPPLRQRLEDIPELAEHFALRLSSELGWDYFPGFTQEAMDSLFQYHWPGNIREFRNVIERSVFRTGQTEEKISTVIIDPFQTDQTKPVETAPLVTEDTEETHQPFKQQVENFQKQLLINALKRHQHHQAKAAEELQLSYDQMRGLIRKFKLNQ
ncbi:phage shock protein operon transcriptional activator [Gynuella sunshinyii]|uniref:Transcriptional regulator containing GAF, AAA-type ATPase, and DNA binding domain n=1 Tax=Gynuella sunshinyii YC6258 TaxID=1445510 RepID=A0A0C5VDJ1_9GAMM|nr:phage shock protein operon transcriptional activator [Gynuella sunshinyii]AJQ92607.1 transcriptional regulator containing GAF, AAA-type ATPase, and DNA binding domain [Gynuella sunshinyii YC6258]